MCPSSSTHPGGEERGPRHAHKPGELALAPPHDVAGVRVAGHGDEVALDRHRVDGVDAEAQWQARRALVADPGLRPRPEAAAAHGVVETIHCRNRLVALEREMTLAVVDGSGARRGPRPPGRRRPGRGERRDVMRHALRDRIPPDPLALLPCAARAPVFLLLLLGSRPIGLLLFLLLLLAVVFHHHTTAHYPFVELCHAPTHVPDDLQGRFVQSLGPSALLAPMRQDHRL